MSLSRRISRLEVKARGGKDVCTYCRGSVPVKVMEAGSPDHSPNSCPQCRLKGMVIVIEYTEEWRSNCR